MALDTMLAADIEQQLKPLDAAGRAQFLLDLVEVVYNYATSDAVGEVQAGRDTSTLEAVRDAARTHAEAQGGESS
ncbi:hypothetical protein [Microbacterium stercoris]|uniref:Uncharacterized protein n=1 Tax=Microbacterium stercoris TaxID=2820289 RepID=A0A939QHK7_9MICO|nr:hypothetical protein [Microbacterium stercoris]MBO3662958.1 hypothetical protein [Microbacterium stercoris]